MVLEEIKGSFMKEMFVSISVELERKNYFWCHQINDMLWILETGLKSGVENDLLASGFKELVCTTPAKIPRGFVILNGGPMGINYPSWGPFRESPGNVSVPKSTFQIEI